MKPETTEKPYTRKPWHYCPDWDYLLLHPDDPEMACCTCRPGAIIRSMINFYHSEDLSKGLKPTTVLLNQTTHAMLCSEVPIDTGRLEKYRSPYGLLQIKVIPDDQRPEDEFLVELLLPEEITNPRR